VREKEEAACFSDLGDDLGIERLFETAPGSPDEEPGETLFVVKSSKFRSTTEIIGYVTGNEEYARIAAKRLGVQAGDSRLPVLMLQALDGIAGELNHDPRWIEGVPGPEPVVTHDLEDATVIRNGVQTTISAAEVREMVEAASREGAVWSDEADEDWYETDSPWASWIEADGTRSYHSPFADDNAWPSVVTREVWCGVLAAWASVGQAEDVLDPLMGYTAEVLPEAEAAVEAMEDLAELLADEEGGSVRTVARALALRLCGRRIHIRTEPGVLPTEALSEALSWALGVDGSAAWEPEPPSADAMRRDVEVWVEKVMTHKGVWASQAAAIQALVLRNASPQEARVAGRAAFTR